MAPPKKWAPDPRPPRERGVRQTVWETIRKVKVFSVPDLADMTKNETHTVRMYVNALVKGGYVAIDGMGIDWRRNRVRMYRLTRNVGIGAPRLLPDGTLIPQAAREDRLWRTIKMLRGFTLRDLVQEASCPSCPISEVQAGKYTDLLCKAGYVRRNDDESYVLLSHGMTGPQAPIALTLAVLYDPNKKAVVWQEAPHD